MFGRDSVQVMEVATIERPHRFRLVVEHPDLHYELDHLIDAVHGGGCRVMVIFRSRPETPVGRALHPFMTPFMDPARQRRRSTRNTSLAFASAASGTQATILRATISQPGGGRTSAACARSLRRISRHGCLRCGAC